MRCVSAAAARAAGPTDTSCERDAALLRGARRANLAAGARLGGSALARARAAVHAVEQASLQVTRSADGMLWHIQARYELHAVEQASLQVASYELRVKK